MQTDKPKLNKQADNDLYVIGEVYFRVTYPDAGLCFPIIESFVYLGKNISGDHLEDTWYFQPASDYSWYGSALLGTGRPVVCCVQHELAEMLDNEQLRLMIASSATRRRTKNSQE